MINIDHDHLLENDEADRKSASDTAPNSSMADFDRGIYRSYLDGIDINEDQKDDLLNIVWSMMRMFVDMNLPVDSCGQIVLGLIEQSGHESDSVD
ncbi:hypothetical protein [Methylobacterium trifolii]|uniref:Uncharacterized protein n=1 Tax=Methylobacterium trifolii TaxID=1003092 RepID=A0ABQ4U2N7_9HYPH|nr:hypothetical protein [Methylobacterium trifolii]GJE61011.1 hypothetical protein MPOCJGCO_3131 [Methylobacterium trifolii]